MPGYDVIVLGAGAMGSAAAYYLAKAGQRVLLLEQFEIDHQKGSSYGLSRLIRYSYNDPRYVKLVRAAFPLWHALEEATGETLYMQCGGIDFGNPSSKYLQDTMRSLREMDIAHEILTPEEGRKRFPQFNFTDDMVVVYQPDAGLLKVSACVKAHVRLAEQHGATIRDNTPVLDVRIHDDSVEVDVEGETITADRLVVTAGGWAGRLLQRVGLNLPLEVQRCQVMFLKPKDGDMTPYQIGQMPAFIGVRSDDVMDSIYGMPDYEGTGFKAAYHQGQPVAHPSEVNYTPDADLLDRSREDIGRDFPVLLDAELSLARVCLYTVTPDEDFVIDHHPHHSNVVIAAGFSGHGFKFSTLIGSILKDLSMTGETEHDLSLFKIDRFN
jgi:monomeric sarcosine oxidase